MSTKSHETITKFTQHTKDGLVDYYAVTVETTTNREKWQTLPSGRKTKTIVEETDSEITLFNTQEEAETYLASIHPVKSEVIHEVYR
jgi:hypothetical protein